jgi:ribosome-associated translation inhibitor RaiA
MKIQVNSDKTIAVDASMIRFVQSDVRSVLGRFAAKVTRVEVHLSDVENRKTSRADKRCLVEVRPAGARPLAASATDSKLGSAVHEALRKMQRLLTTFFGRMGRTAAVAVSTRASAASKTTRGTKKKAAAKKSAARRPKKLSSRRPKKKWIYQARRKPWPAR